MTQQIINVGSAINDGTGEPARTAFTKSNDNFTELYAAVTAANQVFYCDWTDAADVATYKRLLLTPSTQAESSVPVSCTGTGDVLVGVFITDPGVPGAIDFPAGSAYRRLYGSVSAGVARFHLQVYTRTTGGVETLARDEFSNSFSNLTATLQEWLATPASGGTLSATDRLVVKIYAQRVSGPTTITVTFYTEGSAHASQIQTTITTGSSTSISASPPLTLSSGNLTIDLSAYQTAPQGRLTLQTATPVMTTTQAAKTTIYYSPYVGSRLPLYDGSAMVMTTFAELSVATIDTTKNPAAIGVSKVNDWFVWSDAGTLRLSHGPDWTSAAARSAGTALVLVNGIWLNNVAITNGPAASRGTYVGTTRSNASSQLDWIYGGNRIAASFMVWNCYNRVQVAAAVTDDTASWTYGSTTYRSRNGSATVTAFVEFVLGLQEDAVAATNYGRGTSDASANQPVNGIALDGVTTLLGSQSGGTNFANGTSDMACEYNGTLFGYHFLYAVEAAFNGGAVTWYGFLVGPPARTTAAFNIRLRM